MSKKICLTASGRLLEHIGVGLYSAYDKAIAELIVNAYDAEATKVDVVIGPSSITIDDNGTGMGHKDIANYCILGGNSKRSGAKRTATLKRLPVGAKGVGKVAGLGIAQLMTVSTMKDGKCLSFTLDKHQFDEAKSLEDAAFDIHESASKTKGSGTLVMLTKFLPHIMKTRFDTPKLRSYLARELPRSNDFVVTVNGEVCTVTDIPAKRKVQVNLDLPLCGKVTGTIIVAKKPLEEPGLTITVRSRTVGKPFFFGLEGFIANRSAKTQAAKLITGFIEVTGFDPEDGSLDTPVILTSREALKTDHPRYIELLEGVRPVLKAVLMEEVKAMDQVSKMKDHKMINEALKDAVELLNKQKNNFRNLFAEAQEPAVNGKPPEPKKFEDIQAEQKEKELPEKKERPEKTDRPESEKPHRIKIGAKSYQPILRPLGEDSYECVVDELASEIIINTDHPSYEVVKEVKPPHFYLARMIIEAVVCKKVTNSAEAYNNIDSIVRAAKNEVEA